MAGLSLLADTEHDGCWFRFDGNQAMRNVALARSLVQRGWAERAVVALCAPKAHRSIWRRWAEVKSLLQVPDVTLHELPADDVVRYQANRHILTERYLLDPDTT